MPRFVKNKINEIDTNVIVLNISSNFIATKKHNMMLLKKLERSWGGLHKLRKNHKNGM
jgi:hypothetical protein